MARPKKKMTVVLTRKDAQWIASVAEDASLSTSAHNTRRVRSAIQTMITDKHGDIDIEFEIRLPEEERQLLKEHIDEEKQLKQLIERIPASRVALAERLLSIHLTQQEVSEMLGLSQGHLAVILRRQATSAPPVKPSTRRTTGR
jgi:CRP-like cAMP-binding protein